MTMQIQRPPSWGEIVWTQYRASWANKSALVMIGLLVVMAVYAPLLSSSQPLLWCAQGRCTSPWLAGLFFNANVYESGIDIFFNLLMFFLPLWILLARRQWKRGLYQTSSEAAQGARRLHLALWGSLLAVFFAMMVFQPQVALPDYRGLASNAASRAASDIAVAWFAPLRMHYSDVLFGAEGPGLHHLLGLDTSGRDVFVRLLYGTRVSLSVGVIAVAIYLSIGVVVGAFAGYFGGWADILTERTVEIFICFPTFFLILTFISFLDAPSIVWVMVFIGIVGWTGPARLVRGEFLRIRGMDYVVAARALGLPDRRIIFGHILPNALGPVLVSATFGVANAIIAESTLSFLGIGDRVLPSWGRILALGRATGDTPMMLIAGAMIFFTVVSLNMAGEGLRDALDPKLRQ